MAKKQRGGRPRMSTSGTSKHRAIATAKVTGIGRTTAPRMQPGGIMPVIVNATQPPPWDTRTRNRTRNKAARAARRKNRRT